MQYAVRIHVESGDLNDMQPFDDNMQVNSSFFFFNKGMQQDGSICQPGDRTTANACAFIAITRKVFSRTVQKVMIHGDR